MLQTLKAQHVNKNGLHSLEQACRVCIKWISLIVLHSRVGLFFNLSLNFVIKLKQNQRLTSNLRDSRVRWRFWKHSYVKPYLLRRKICSVHLERGLPDVRTEETRRDEDRGCSRQRWPRRSGRHVWTCTRAPERTDWTSKQSLRCSWALQLTRLSSVITTTITLRKYQL